MTESTSSSGLSRRQFLLMAGATAAATLASSGSVPLARLLPGAGRPLRLGVLLPDRTFSPRLAQNLLAGLQLHLAGRGRAALHVLTAEVGQRSTLAATRHLLDEGVDLLVGMVNADMALRLHPLLAEREVPLIASAAGANLPHADTPFLFYNSLGLWQGNYALGRWAAQNLGRRAVVAASAYDSGFDAFNAFEQGFTAAGGQVQATHVTHRPVDGNNGLERLFQQIGREQPDLVAAFYCGEPAADFLQAYRENSVARRLPLVGGAFLVDEPQLAATDGTALDVYSAFSWAPALELDENRQFQRRFQRRQARPADAFALLGYETARLLEQAVAQAGSLHGGRLRAAFAEGFQNSPRGSWQMDSATQQAATPLYLRRVQRADGRLHNAVLSTLPAVTLPLSPALKSGWLQAYLAV